jgi:hypothetical protein
LRFTHSILAAAICLLAASARSAEPQAPIYKDPHQPVDKRVDDLLARMTLD